jgi:hypothetical protein
LTLDNKFIIQEETLTHISLTERMLVFDYATAGAAPNKILINQSTKGNRKGKKKPKLSLLLHNKQGQHIIGMQ